MKANAENVRKETNQLATKGNAHIHVSVGGCSTPTQPNLVQAPGTSPGVKKNAPAIPKTPSPIAAFFITVTVAFAGCDNAATKADKLMTAAGFKDTPAAKQPDPVQIDIIVGAGIAGGNEVAALSETLARTASFACEHGPESRIRLWTLNADSASMIEVDGGSSARGSAPLCIGAEPRSREMAIKLYVDASMSAFVKMKTTGARTNFATGLTKVALAETGSGDRWVVVLGNGFDALISSPVHHYTVNSWDRMPSSGSGPSGKSIDARAWIRLLEDHRLLPPDCFKNAHMVFAFDEPVALPCYRTWNTCPGSEELAAMLRDLWQAALTRTGAASIVFALRAFDFPAAPKPAPTNASTSPLN